MRENSLIAARNDLKGIEGRQGEMYVFGSGSLGETQRKDTFLSGVEKSVTIPKSRFHGEVNPDVLKNAQWKDPKTRYYAKEVEEKKGLPKYPFVSWKAFAEDGNGLKIPIYYAVHKSISPLKKSLEDYVMAGGDLITNLLVYPAVNALHNWSGQQFGTKSQEVFPKFRAWYDFSRGASTIERLYTVSYTIAGMTREFPLAATSPGEPAPTDEKLIQAVRTVRDEYKSQLNGDELAHFYRKDFSLIAAEKYTRGDFKKLVEPGFFRKWFVRDDTWLIQQYGEKDLALEKDVLVDGSMHHVNAYKRPSEFLFWAYWAIGDKIYDGIDTFYDPLQRYMEGKIPPQAEQIMLRDEYRAIAGMRRGFFNTARTNLEYDLTKYLVPP